MLKQKLDLKGKIAIVNLIIFVACFLISYALDESITKSPNKIFDYIFCYTTTTFFLVSLPLGLIGLLHFGLNNTKMAYLSSSDIIINFFIMIILIVLNAYLWGFLGSFLRKLLNSLRKKPPS